MSIQAYEDEVFDLVEDLRADRTKRGAAFRYSDMFDAAGLQYVNLVQEGGGILGIALLGFTYVLEELGLRFLSLGGTSAGSINTLLMADLGTPEEPKSLRILEQVAGKQFMDFVDGGRDAERLTHLIKAAMNGRSTFSLLAQGPEVFAALGNLPELFQRYGINPGKHFADWLRSVLQHADWRTIPVLIYAHTREDLDKLYDRPLPPNILNSPGRNTIRHRHLVEEVVDGLSKIAPL